MLDVSNIRMEIAEILKECFDADIDLYSREDIAAGFFSEKYAMPFYTLLYLVVMLESKYGLCFSDDDYDSDDFYCLEGIADIIAKKLKKKEPA